MKTTDFSNMEIVPLNPMDYEVELASLTSGECYECNSGDCDGGACDCDGGGSDE